MVEGAFGRVVVVDGIKQVAVEVGPFLEGILLAEHARGNVSRYERRLDGQRAASAHRVDEVALAPPSRHQHYRRCQHLVQRSLHALLTVSASVQRLARRVERQRGAVVGNVDVEPQVGIAHRDVWPLARALA